MKIGQHAVVRLLGKGGMSEVYEVEDPRLGSRHALKLFTYEKDDQEVMEHFLTEGKLLARLSHPRIVKVTDFGTDEASGKPYFVMDLVLNEHGKVQQLFDVEPGTADEETIGKWYDDLRDGLAYIHANGVIHRDLKLQNVLIGPDGHAVLTDFGISKIFDAKGDGVRLVDTVKTIVRAREGHSLVMGSLGYMAPELEMGVAASPQSDWYALGVIVYRLLTGTWCDARTDVVGTLETYDPVWKRIIPKLLHSNPQGRECLSYADEKRIDREEAEFEWEDRWLKEKRRGHLARHLMRFAFLLLAVGVIVGGWVTSRYEQRLAAADAIRGKLERQLAVPTFSDVFHLPDEAKLFALKIPANTLRIRGTLVDAWVLTQAIFDDLKAGRVTPEKAVGDMEDLAVKAESNPFGLFDLNGGYVRAGDIRLLPVLLHAAADEMRRQLGLGE